MRNWLLFLFLATLFACSKPDDENPSPTPQQPKEELNGWQKITTNVNDYFADIAFTTPAIGYLAGGNGTYKSTDSGKTWLLDPSIITRPVTINFYNQQYGYSVGSVPSLELTQSSGSNWQRKSIVPARGAVDVSFVTPAVGYVALQSGPVLKTVDTGNTWQAVGNFTNRECLSVFFLNEQQGWYGVRDSVYRTVNGGSTWSGQKISNSTVFTVFFADANNGWATSDTSVYRTVNGGNAWTKTFVPGSTYDLHFVNAQTGFVSTNNGVFKTTDGGATWVRSLTAELGVFPELIFLNENTGWVTAGSNIIYRWKK